MKILLEFKNSHHYWEKWKRVSKLFCPNCGKKEIWKQEDFCEDESYVCVGCRYMFTMNYGSVRRDEWSQIPKQLKSGVVNKPTTPEGH